MPCPMLYWSCLHGYVPYTRGLRSGPAEWIILWMARKRKLANSFILFVAMNKFSCLILPIIHAYNVGISWLWSEDETPFVCLTLVGRHNFDHMPDSGWRTWLWSYARLRSEDMTPIVYPDSRCTSRFQSTSQLRSYLLTPVAHHGSGRWACGMSYHLSCETLHMTGLDDCSILQPRYLVWSRLGGTHDSFSDWNLSISWLRKFKCQAMYRATNEH
jgi:hypothetical protein